MLKQIVAGVEALALLAIGVFVLMLFANEPGGRGSAGDPGAEVYSSSCATCHGSDGGGGVGPRLAGGAVVDAYPNVADEIAVVTDGTSGGMPGFGDRLSAEEIEQAVEYTRNL
ncbi:MAG TPA: cytochrome c [Acidimicrobiia bacterium]|nr:cytochrome c [Acidimicrobiia bacterium]